ncbi:MAG TPA: aminomethyl-transferring glycine dehydrogenase subunit GcvPB [Nitrospinota bacterium]|jgi:glycine dehydrogenase subunit 2|nr:aminomethyl-transferring glycine dehydrogenase subunit GcvPB [Nitrospinota bacterium]
MSKNANNIYGASGLVFNEPLIFDLGTENREAYSLPKSDVPEENIDDLIPANQKRDEIKGFPEVSEIGVIRHFTRLSQWNFSVDHGFYPLGSCTMKYNPKINEDIARTPAFTNSHPLQQEQLSQGNLQLMYELAQDLAEISGMDKVSLQPAAGAQGELAGMMMVRAYHQKNGNPRKKVLLPDSAHGTNPATSTLSGYEVVSLKSNDLGLLNPQVVKNAMDENVAALMLTNPNTLGLFEKDILEITEIVHDKGGLVYCDGANLNALMGISKIGDMGVDVMHFNLHKTFSTPHGGGGPGSGPVGVKNNLIPFLPIPIIDQKNNRYFLNYDHPQSIGKLKGFYGNFSIFLRAYAYIKTLGKENIRKVSEIAVLNANYIRSRLKEDFHLAYESPSLHECVFSDKNQLQHGVSTLDIAKALIDYGFHPPTIYFPLIVKGALMIEPTETEAKKTLDKFVEAMKDIAKRTKEDPKSLHHTPLKSKVSRLDETLAARKPKLRWKPQE